MNEELLKSLVELAETQNTLLKGLASLLEKVEKLQTSVDFLSGKNNEN